eukprot:6196770-Pleurochrysis_carterae.AAC.2
MAQCRQSASVAESDWFFAVVGSITQMRQKVCAVASSPGVRILDAHRRFTLLPCDTSVLGFP